MPGKDRNTATVLPNTDNDVSADEALARSLQVLIIFVNFNARINYNS